MTTIMDRSAYEFWNKYLQLGKPPLPKNVIYLIKEDYMGSLVDQPSKWTAVTIEEILEKKRKVQEHSLSFDNEEY